MQEIAEVILFMVFDLVAVAVAIVTSIIAVTLGIIMVKKGLAWLRYMMAVKSWEREYFRNN